MQVCHYKKYSILYFKIGCIHANKWLIVNHWNPGEEGSCRTQGSSGPPITSPTLRLQSLLLGQTGLPTRSLGFLQLHLLKLKPRLGKYILHASYHKQVPDCWRHPVSTSFLCLSMLFTVEFSQVQMGSPWSIF